jgi:hypothetical protein
MSVNGKVLMSLVMLAIFVAMVAIASTYPADTRFLPFVIGIPGIVLALIQVVNEVIDARRVDAHAAAKPSPDATLLEIAEAAAHGAFEEPPEMRKEIVLFAYFVGLAAAVLLLGFWLSIPLFVVVFLRFHERESWRLTLSLTAGAWVSLYLVFDRLLGIIVHEGFVTEYVLG